MAQPINTQALSGFADLLPKEQIKFNQMLSIIRKNFEVFGFIPLDTPLLERAEVLLSKAGGETEQQIYRFTKGDTDLAMRYDHTVPLARYVAEHQNDLKFPFKRYAIGKVYRGERPQAGRFREFYQCDIDVIGNEKLDTFYDAELPSIIYQIFQELAIGKFTIRINNRKIFNGLFEHLGIVDNASDAMRAIDKLEKIGVNGVWRELSEVGISDKAATKLFEFLEISKDDDVLAGLNGLGIDHPEFQRGLDELRAVIDVLDELGVPEEYFTVDLTIARGLDYYTGTIYETTLDAHPEIGSICSGGRYENLTGQYTSRNYPGTGISIGLTRLFDQLTKLGIIQLESATPTVVLIASLTNDMKPALELATQLRENGLPTEISPSSEKLKNVMKYADGLGIKYVILIGEDEITKGIYTVKDMQLESQTECTTKEVLKLFTGDLPAPA